MNHPSDQRQRERFAREIDSNFSVVASAGSGKTHAITERILSIATSPHACDWLPQLVVVTFTNRAADEMQQRARQRLLEAGVPLRVSEAFNRAFFGTIHSFCLKLLRSHGHRLGLPAQPELVTDDTPLWREFVQQTVTIGRSLEADQRALLFRFVSAASVMELGRRAELARHNPLPCGACDRLDLGELLALVPNRSVAQGNVDKTKRAAREWQRVLDETSDFAPLPEMFGTATDLVEVWTRTFAPLRDWIQRAALCVGCDVARDFREFRLKHGALTYDDQVALASQLFDDPEIARRIRERNYRVILDEAQDTDPEQFMVLLQVARPLEAIGRWPEEIAGAPRAGHFCMVGDFQQSIYGQRADLGFYRRIHDALTSNGVGEAVPFSVTFRLDEAQLDFANAVFSKVFLPADGQVRFQPLELRPNSLPGQVVGLGLPPAEFETDAESARHEAEYLAQWLQSTGLDQLRASQWSDVAIICPRKSWFPVLRSALRCRGFEVQLQSEREIRGEHPSVAWFTALLVVMAEPYNAFELAGVLREVFGISDHDLAVYSAGDRARLNIGESPTGRGPVPRVLRELHELRERITGEPLLTQVEQIVKVTKLRVRLLSLPAEEYEGLGEMLDELILTAAVVESTGLSLRAFADQLRHDFEKVRDPRATRANAIQIITGHKAKGSEWSVVVLPFLGREVGNASPKYPMVVRGAEGQPIVLFDGVDRKLAGADWIEKRDRHESERLLYVALTRAKHTLVLVDDRDFFLQRSGTPKNAQARSLRMEAGGANEAGFQRLPGDAMPCAQTMRRRREHAEERAGSNRIVPLDSIDPVELARASERAHVFVKRNPSGLVLPPSRAAEMDATKMPEPTPPSLNPDYPGKAYGIWWHNLVEILDWREEPNAWQPHFERSLTYSPDPERSQLEWPLFISTVQELSGLRGASNVSYPEMPFLWRLSDAECVEGIIDLAVYDPAGESWLIVDWKTNRIAAGQAHWLREKYEPQLAAYRAALMAITGAPVRAAIYSTMLGCWLDYDDAVLDTQWSELSSSPEALEEALCL